MASQAECAVEGCVRSVRARGWCIGHYNRWYLNGDPGVPELVKPAREKHHRWAGDQIGYHGAHHRVRLHRGPAMAHTCIECNEPAEQWAYQHTDPAELQDERGHPYSADPQQYAPMCCSCHTKSDHARKAAS